MKALTLSNFSPQNISTFSLAKKFSITPLSMLLLFRRQLWIKSHPLSASQTDCRHETFLTFLLFSRSSARTQSLNYFMYPISILSRWFSAIRSSSTFLSGFGGDICLNRLPCRLCLVFLSSDLRLVLPSICVPTSAPSSFLVFPNSYLRTVSW